MGDSAFAVTSVCVMDSTDGINKPPGSFTAAATSKAGRTKGFLLPLG